MAQRAGTIDRPDFDTPRPDGGGRRFDRTADDPHIRIEPPTTIFDAIPPYPPRSEREAEFYSIADGEMLINLGPQHPSTHGVLRVVAKVNGEEIVDLDPVIGYLHRGVEKICEDSDYQMVISHTDPLDYVSSLHNEAAPVIAFEKLLDLHPPRRAEYIRVLCWELNRVLSHNLFIGWLALDIGALTPILYGFVERDEIAEMLAALTGQRLLYNYLRIGGVNGDLNHEFMSRLGDWMSRALTQVQANADLITDNEIFVKRTKGVGYVDRKTALDLSMTGPNLRALGVPYDVRRAHPYSVYPELEFEIPVREEGDSYARYLVRIEEIKQSIHIIDQVLNRMPDGPCLLPNLPRLVRPRPGRAWAAVESPRGQYGAYVISDGSHVPFRFRIHDPSFNNLQALQPMSVGGLVQDTITVLASLDPVMGGVDK